MELTEALRIVNTLAEGFDPTTGEPLPADHVCQKAQVIRALHALVLRVRIPDLPSLPLPSETHLNNAGKPWSAIEDAQLVQAFDAGEKLTSLARKHGRTKQAIHGRLYRLGKIPAWSPSWNGSAEAKKYD